MQTSGKRKFLTGHSTRAVLECARVGAIYFNMVAGSLVQVARARIFIKPEVDRSSPQQEQEEKREEKRKRKREETSMLCSAGMLYSDMIKPGTWYRYLVPGTRYPVLFDYRSDDGFPEQVAVN